MEEYQIKLPVFNGPMELLMHLIDKNKIDIYDIPIASLTEQYMAYLDQLREFNIAIASEFLVMAATLLSIKSMMMLPKPEKEEDEEEADPRQELLQRILEYRQFQKVTAVLEQAAENEGRLCTRAPAKLSARRVINADMPVSALVEAFRMVLAVRKDIESPREAVVRHERFTVEQRMQDMVSLLRRRGGRIGFSEAFGDGGRDELIGTFLALLELMLQKTVSIRQTGLFSPIVIILSREGDA